MARGSALLATTLLLTGLGAAVQASPSGPGTEQGPPTIDTYEGWDGSALGCLNPLYTSCGQVITIPSGKTRLREYTMYFLVEAEGRVRYRAEIYTWDGTKAKREVWESERMAIRQDPQFDFKEIRFTPRVKVRPGEQYILFLTFSRDYKALDPDTGGYLAAMPEDRLPDGTPADLDDAGDESQWTTRPWWTDRPEEWEVAMKVWLR